MVLWRTAFAPVFLGNKTTEGNKLLKTDAKTVLYRTILCGQVILIPVMAILKQFEAKSSLCHQIFWLWQYLMKINNLVSTCNKILGTISLEWPILPFKFHHGVQYWNDLARKKGPQTVTIQAAFFAKAIKVLA